MRARAREAGAADRLFEMQGTKFKSSAKGAAALGGLAAGSLVAGKIVGRRKK